MDAPSEDAGWASRTASGRSSTVLTSRTGTDAVTSGSFVDATLCVRGLATFGAIAEGVDESSDVRFSTSGAGALRCGRAADAFSFAVAALSVAGADPCFDADLVVV
jgi:hypothetical protein